MGPLFRLPYPVWHPVMPRGASLQLVRAARVWGGMHMVTSLPLLLLTIWQKLLAGEGWETMGRRWPSSVVATVPLHLVMWGTVRSYQDLLPCCHSMDIHLCSSSCSVQEVSARLCNGWEGCMEGRFLVPAPVPGTGSPKPQKHAKKLLAALTGSAGGHRQKATCQ